MNARLVIAALLLTATGTNANSEAETLCAPWGGLKKIRVVAEEQSSMSYRRLAVECKDGSWVSRSVYQ